MTQEKRKAGLRAGAVQVEITPRFGVQLGGDVGIRRRAQSVLDPLYARALVFESGGSKVCFLALDAIFVSRDCAEHIRRAAAERLGVDADAVMVHATQTHSAPPLGGFLLDQAFPLPRECEWLTLGDREYSDWAVERAIEAVRLACESLQPVRIGVGSGVKAGLAFNRRAVLHDGTVVMPWIYSDREKPLGPTEIVYMEGPMDPEVGVLCAQDQAMGVVGMLLNYTCHPVNVFCTRGIGFNPRVSADWPGAWAEAMREAYGETCVPLVLNGCCGNINPWPPFQPDFVPDHRRMGRALAEMADRIIGNMSFTGQAILDWKSIHINIPLREVDAEQVEEARELISEDPQPVWSREDPNRVDPSWFDAAMLVCLDMERQRAPELPYEIQVLRVGDTAFVGLPGEPFVEGQLRVKLASPASRTYVAHATNHYAGYIPTREALARGGHEANLSSWSKLAPEALDMIVDATLGALDQVFPR